MHQKPPYPLWVSLLCAFAGVCMIAVAAPLSRAHAQTNVQGVTTTRAAGVTSATVGAFVQALPPSAVYQRRNCQVTNTSASAGTIDVGDTPSAATARPWPAGSTFDCAHSSGAVLMDRVWVSNTTASQPFVVWTQQ